jgi:hypothetical protein
LRREQTRGSGQLRLPAPRGTVTFVFGVAFGRADPLVSAEAGRDAQIRADRSAGFVLVAEGTLVVWIPQNVLGSSEPTEDRRESYGSSGLIRAGMLTAFPYCRESR